VFSGLDPRYRNILLFSSGLIIFLSIIINGSRTGFLCGGLALFTSLMIIYCKAEIMKRRPVIRTHKLGSVMIAALGFLLSGFLVFLFFASDRLPAFSRVIEMDSMADLRARAMPTLFDMIGTYWPFGAGFGTFDKLYYIHEPNELLMPSYFNQAHNDWLQIIIEGGALAAIMILAGLIWYVFSVYKLYVASSKNMTHLLFWFGSLAILSIASAVDYPMRTPIFGVVIIWLLALLSEGRKAYSPNSRDVT
jgi:O-antigen ligase